MSSSALERALQITNSCPPTDAACREGSGGPSQFASTAGTAGIVVGAVVGVLLLCCLCVCCRREKQITSTEVKANANRSSIVNIKGSIKEMRSSTAIKEMSNVEKATLKREITENLVIKKVEKSAGPEKKSFLDSLCKSERAYSSFAAALRKSKTAVELTDAAEKDDIEKGAANEEETVPQPDVSVDRRRSNAMARSLSVKLSNKDDTTKCFLCLMTYEKGDEVAFSKNEACPHGFHKECIVDWLLKRPVCPICREDFEKTDGGES
jgi:hypothetical protein